eukprot:tig00000789_g4143.t1
MGPSASALAGSRTSSGILKTATLTAEESASRRSGASSSSDIICRTVGGTDYLSAAGRRPAPGTAGKIRPGFNSSFWDKDASKGGREPPLAMFESPELPECLHTTHGPQRAYIPPRVNAVKSVAKPPRAGGAGNPIEWDPKVQQRLQEQRDREKEQSRAVTDALYLGRASRPLPERDVLYSRPRAPLRDALPEAGQSWWYRQQHRHDSLATQSRVPLPAGHAEWVSRGGPTYLHSAPRGGGASGGASPAVVSEFLERRAAYERNKAGPSPIS